MRMRFPRARDKVLGWRAPRSRRRTARRRLATGPGRCGRRTVLLYVHWSCVSTILASTVLRELAASARGGGDLLDRDLEVARSFAGRRATIETLAVFRRIEGAKTCTDLERELRVLELWAARPDLARTKRVVVATRREMLL